MAAVRLFGADVDLPNGWEDRTVHTFFLDEGPSSGGAAGAGARPMVPGAGTAPGPGFRPNLVVTRQPSGARDLAAFVAEQGRALKERFPSARTEREGAVRLGPVDGHEMVLRLGGGRGAPDLVQWHVAAERGGWFIQFCTTTSSARLEADRAAVRAVVDAWADASG